MPTSPRLEIHKRIEAPFHSARTQLEWARMLFTRNCPGDLDRATQLLATARKLARRYGCALVEQRTEALLGRSQESGTASTEHIHRVQPLMTTRRVSWEAPGRVGIVSGKAILSLHYSRTRLLTWPSASRFVSEHTPVGLGAVVLGIIGIARPKITPDVRRHNRAGT
jgi:hypothetical protein